MSTRTVAAGVGAAVPLAILGGSLIGSPPFALAIIGGALILGWLRVPSFWRHLFRSVLVGGVAGILVLGPGLRLAMRVVALMDSARFPEFTLEGTMFLVLIVGGLLGAITVGWASLIARALSLPRWGGSLLVFVATGLQLFADSETLREFTDLGAGVWVNAPMFGGVLIAFAYFSDRWARPEPAVPVVPHPSDAVPVSLA